MQDRFAWMLVLYLLVVPGCPNGAPPGDDDVAADDDVSSDDDATDGDDDSTISDDDSTSDDDDTTPTNDHDGDGWTVARGDCDDTDASVHPEAEEILCDGVDNDCDDYGILSGAALNGVEYATVPHALSAAMNGDTVYICPGIHTGQLFINDERRLYLTSFSGNRDDTILDGAGLETVVHIGEDNVVDLSHLTIRNGLAEPWVGGDYAGGGVMSFSDSTQVLDCVFVDNRAPQDGAGGAAITVCRTGDSPESVALVVEDCLFEDNETLGDGGGGGAITATTSSQQLSVTLTGSTFTGNRSENQGGALEIYVNNQHGEGGVDLRVDDCAFEGNEAGYTGGAMCVYNWHSFHISGSSFLDNYCGYEGGAISLWNPKAEPSVFEVGDTSVIG